MPQGFRFEPTTVRHDRVVARSRLTRLLNGRFAHRVTTVIGAAGYGKTTALALAVESNRLDPQGSDAWLTVMSSSTTGAQLMNGIAAALNLNGDGDIDATIERITDSMWSAAPEDVAIILDDVHLIGSGEPMSALASLLSAMPANGHLVIGSRHRIDLPVARLRAHGELLEVGIEELALDDDELLALQHRGSVPVHNDDHQLPRHVATADLQLAAGINAGADFLWEEVLVRMEPDRLMHLRRCAVLEELDDQLVLAVSDGAFDTEALLDGLPLVERFDGGSRMHTILRTALAARLEPGERHKTLSIAAAAHAERGNFPMAVHLYFEANDPISALDAARDFAVAPTMIQTIDDVVSTRRIVMQIDPDAPVTKLLEAITHFAGLEAQIGDLLMEAADVARDAGDVRLEAVALYRAGQTRLLHHAPDYWKTHARIKELARRDEYSAAVFGYFSSIIHQLDGKATEAIECLDAVGGLGRSTELSARSERLYDLGRPEQVAVGLTTEDLMQLPPGAAAFIGLSIWARGHSSPEASVVAVTNSIEQAMRARYTHPLVSNLVAGVLIALAARENDLARRWVLQVTEVAADGVGPAIEEGALIARAAAAAVMDSDEAAITMLQEESSRFEYYTGDKRKWPSRAQLGSMPLLYLARPELRATFNSSNLGPNLCAAVAAGRALVAIREDGDVDHAADLPWGRTNLLRAHVLPHHLVELACAAIAHGHHEARSILDHIPRTRELLERVASTNTSAAGDTARDILGTTPRPEPFVLHALALGPVALERDGAPVDATEFTNRPKVRELFTLLVERGNAQRHDLCALLWPEHDNEDKALSSLRTTLPTLNDVLEPSRSRGASAFHLRATSDAVELDHRVTSDVAAFENLVTAAQTDDNAGLPGRALDGYRLAAEMYRGDYVQGIDAQWVVLPRLRLRALAVAAMCRIAELTAAKGEPEDAARWAERARTVDPLNERAGRLFVSALDASGDRSAARAAAHELVDTLQSADLALSPPTQRLIDRLQ